MKMAKKFTAFFLVSLLFVTLAPMLASADVIEGINGTFQTNEDGSLPVWGSKIEAKQFADGEAKPYDDYAGNYGAVTNTATSSGPEFDVEPGQSVVVSGYFKGNGGLTVYVTYYDADGKWLAEAKPVLYPGENWSAFIQSYVVPENAAKADVKFRNNSGGDKCQNIADIKIDVKDPTMLPDITAWGGVTSGITLTKLPTGGKDGAPAISLPTNELAWKRIAVHQFTADSNPKWEANVAYKLTLFYKSDISLDSGKPYAPLVRLIYNGNNKDYGISTSEHSVNEWNEGCVNFVLPADMNLATSKIEIMTDDITSTAGTLLISDVKLEKDTTSTSFWNGNTQLENNQIISNGIVNIKHHLVGDVSKIAVGSSTQAKANVVVALYKVENNTRKIIKIEIKTIDMWAYQKSLAKGTDVEIPFEIEEIETGKYELKVIDLDLDGTLKTLSKVANHTAEYNAQ